MLALGKLSCSYPERFSLMFYLSSLLSFFVIFGLFFSSGLYAGLQQKGVDDSAVINRQFDEGALKISSVKPKISFQISQNSLSVAGGSAASTAGAGVSTAAVASTTAAATGAAAAAAIAAVALVAISSSRGGSNSGDKYYNPSDSGTDVIFHQYVTNDVGRMGTRSVNSVSSVFQSDYGLSATDVIWMKTELANANLLPIAMLDAPLAFRNSTQVFSTATFNKTEIDGFNYSDSPSPKADHAEIVASVISGKNMGILSTGGESRVKIYHAAYDYSKSPIFSDIVSHPGWAFAVVMNNSWGIIGSVTDASLYETLRQIKVADDAGSNLDAFSSADVDEYRNFKNLATNLINFSKHGVIVWANSNDKPNDWQRSNSTDAFAEAYLPKLFGYTDTMITVSNYNVSDILFLGSSTESLSKIVGSHCYLTMDYCVVADGTFVPAKYIPQTSSTKTPVISGFVGNSFAAPQVSAMAYLVARKFPNNTPQQWRDRILMTADLSTLAGYASTLSGTKTFNKIEGDSLQKNVSWLYGLGKPNLGRALNPLGAVFMVTGGKNLWSADLSNVKDTSIKSYGSALSNLSTLDQTILTYDSLGYAFSMPLGRLFQSDQPSYLGVLSHKHRVSNNVAPNLTLAADRAVYMDSQSQKNGFSINYTSDDYQLFYGYQNHAFLNDLKLDALQNLSTDYINYQWHQPSFLSAFDSQYALGFSTNVDEQTALHLGMVGGSFGLAASNQSFLFNLSSAQKNLAYNVFFSQSYEKNALLDAEFSGGFGLAFKHFANYVGASFATGFDRWQLSMSFNLGFWDQVQSNTAVRLVDQLRSSQWSLTLSQKASPIEGRWYVGVKQPRRIESGQLKLRLNTGFSNGHLLSYSDQVIDLTPKGRQNNFFVGYKKRLDALVDMSIEFNYIDHVKHHALQKDWQLSVLFSH